MNRNKELNIGIIGLDPYNENRGVGALAYSTLMLLEKASRNIDRKFNIYIIANPKGKNRHNSISILGDEYKFEYLFPFELFRLKGFIKTIAFFPLNGFRFNWVKKYLALDCILNLGGDCYTDIYGKEIFAALNGMNIVSSLLCKKQLWLPQTIGPFTDKKIIKKARKSIESATVIMTRDKQSYDYVKENTTQAEVHEFVDVAFYMPYKRTLFSDKFIHVGIGASALLWNQGYTQQNQFGLRENYQQLIHRIIKYFLQMDNIQIHFIAHVPHGDGVSIEDDYALADHLFQEYGSERTVLAPFFITPISAKNYISGLNFFTGSRMHACIAAFSSGVPLFPLAYSRKFSGLFSHTLDYKYMSDLQSETATETLSGLKNAYAEKDRLEAFIGSQMDTIIIQKEVEMMQVLEKFLNALKKHDK